jgi:outer membrane protein TolC
VLQIAEARSASIAGAQAGIRRAEGDRVRAQSGRYPQLSASASYDRALASEFEGVFDTSGGPPYSPHAVRSHGPAHHVADTDIARPE